MSSLPLLIALLLVSPVLMDPVYSKSPDLGIMGYETPNSTNEDYPMPVGNFGNFFLSYGKEGLKKQALYNNYWDSVGGTYSQGDANLYNFFTFTLNNRTYVLQEKGFNEYENVNTTRHDLFPLTCIEFENLPVNLTLFSPFIFNDVQNSTIPVHCFIFQVKNEGDDPMRFSLSFNFENDIGWRDPETGEWNLAGNYNLPIETEKYLGFELKCNESEKKGNLSGKEYIGNMTILTTRDCKLEEYETDERKIVKITKEIDLAPKEEMEIPFILATCFPYFSPGGKDYSIRWDESWKVREYYEWYWKNSYENSKEMAIEAIETYGEWLEKIEKQQKEIFDSVDGEVAKLLLNSLHIFGSESFFSREGYFFTIEGEFTLLHTLDVMLYSHLFLVNFFPEIARAVIKEYCIAMSEEGRVPHSLWYDYADNHEEPNFVIMAYQTSVNDKEFMKEIYPYVKKAMLFRMGEDVREDMLMHNSGGDHGYDTWSAPTMSYINSMWLLALRLSADMADELGEKDDCQFFEATFRKAQESFIEKFWNGKYFNFCCGNFGAVPIIERKGHEIKVPILDKRVCHIEQITGFLFASLLDKEILPEEMAKSATFFIYENNFDRYRRLGWINGVFSNGLIDLFGWFPLYSTMVWSGVQWVLAAQLMAAGFKEEARAVANLTAENQLYRGFNLFHLGEGYTNLIGMTWLNFPLRPFNENFVPLKPPIYPAYARIMACWIYYFACRAPEAR